MSLRTMLEPIRPNPSMPSCIRCPSECRVLLKSRSHIQCGAHEYHLVRIPDRHQVVDGDLAFITGDEWRDDVRGINTSRDVLAPRVVHRVAALHLPARVD